MIDTYIAALADYGVRTGLIEPADRTWAINTLLNVLELQEYIEPEEKAELPLEEILRNLLDFSVQRRVIEGDITSRDLFDTKLMGVLTPRPSQVIAAFQERYARSPKEATDWYYQFSQDTDYIRRYRIAKDMKWTAPRSTGTWTSPSTSPSPRRTPRPSPRPRPPPSPATPSASCAGRTRGTPGA